MSDHRPYANAHPVGGVPWTSVQDDTVRAMLKDCHTNEAISEALGRTMPAIKARIRWLKITRDMRDVRNQFKRNRRLRWNNRDYAIAAKLVERRATDAECRALLGRNFHACYTRVSRGPVGQFRKPELEPRTTIPESVLQEALLRATAPRSLTAILMGDPPFPAGAQS